MSVKIDKLHVLNTTDSGWDDDLECDWTVKVRAVDVQGNGDPPLEDTKWMPAMGAGMHVIPNNELRLRPLHMKSDSDTLEIIVHGIDDDDPVPSDKWDHTITRKKAGDVWGALSGVQIDPAE